MRSVKQIELRNSMAKSEVDLRKIGDGWRNRSVNGRHASPAPGAKKSNSTKELNGKSEKQTKSSKSRTQVDRKSQADHSDDSRPGSVQSRDAFSQTESTDDDFFLKDVIIR